MATASVCRVVQFAIGTPVCVLIRNKGHSADVAVARDCDPLPPTQRTTLWAFRDWSPPSHGPHCSAANVTAEHRRSPGKRLIPTDRANTRDYSVWPDPDR